MAELLLAHDLGTTGNKASLFDASGRLLASAFEALCDRLFPGPAGRSRTPPTGGGRSAPPRSGCSPSLDYGPEDVAGIGFSGQMMCCLPVDDAGRPLRSGIIWADTRAQAEAAVLAERVGGETVYHVTGHRASPNYTAAKLLWLRTHQPDIYRATRRVLQAKDYGAYRLTGVMATDYSDASGTNLFDLPARRWSEALLDAFELPAEWLPPAVASHTVIGEVTREAATATGLRAGTPVVIGGGDGACATAGAGVVKPGDAYNYIGSSSWISFVSRDPLYDDPRQRTINFAHLDPDYVFPTGAMQCGGGSYDWLEGVLRGEGEGRLHAELDGLAGAVPPGARGLQFLPYLMGERSPHWNPQARGAFVGLSMVHGRAEMARAVLEGVAFNLRIILDAFLDHGAPITALRMIGGGSRSAVWRQILSDVFDLPLLRAELTVEATSLGAAIAAGVGVGVLPGYGAAAEMVRVSEGETPRADVGGALCRVLCPVLRHL